VDSHAGLLTKTVAVLRGAGYHVVAAVGFDEARRALDRIEPTVLVTSVRLGSYNGLHLVVRSRVSRPAMSAILTHDVLDPVLEDEARKQEATFLVVPCRRQAFLEHVRASVDAAARRSGLGKPVSLISIAES
jgi:DNA-binding NtrC family response regulator